jgi:hypothetical protein
MLASSTYAWFTMSREVEVKNIQMTASVPEDLQISLGKLTDILGDGSGNPDASHISANKATDLGLAGNQGKLLAGSDDGAATAPDNNGTAVDDLFWANTADISEYYRLGKIIPASSINGEDIFFTPDASGNGKTLKDGAKFYQVAALDSADFDAAHLYAWDTTAKTFKLNGSGGDKARTTLHAITKVTEANDPWNPAAAETGGNTYVSASEWFDTNDDGYYVDIPIWFRSSAKENTTLAVDAYVTTNAAKTNDGSEANDDELYMAARAAIIYTNASSELDSTGLLRIRKDSFASTDSIIDFMYSTNNSGDAVASVDGTTGSYGTAAEYAGGAFLAVPGRDKATTAKYGTAVKAVVRVWLEGEDPNCWNPNAGQDFNISLKFTKEAITDYPDAYNKGTNDQAANLAVDNGTVVTITSTTKNGADSTLKFTYDGNKWNQTAGSFEMLDGWTYKITGNSKTSENLTGATEGANSIASWLKTNVTTKAQAAMTYTITEADTSTAAPAAEPEP